MKQYIRIFISLFLILALTLSFAACKAEETKEPAANEETETEEENKTTAKEEDSIIGTWKAAIDMTEAVNQAISGEDAEVAEYIKIKEFTATVTYILNEDGTYETKVDEEAAQKTIEKMMEDITEGMKKLLEASLEQENVGMTLEEYLQAANTTLDAIVAEAYGETDFTDIFAEFNSKGTYKIDGNKLFSADEGESLSEDEYEIFELSGNKLTLKEVVGIEEDNAALAELIYPLEFNRVK